MLLSYIALVFFYFLASVSREPTEHCLNLAVNIKSLVTSKQGQLVSVLSRYIQLHRVGTDKLKRKTVTNIYVDTFHLELRNKKLKKG